MKHLILCTLACGSLYSNIEEHFQNSLWNRDQQPIIDFINTKINPTTVLEIGMDFGCVILCSKTLSARSIQSVGIKKGYWHLSKALGRRVNFSRVDSRVLHVGKKPKYHLIVLNGIFHHRFMDLSFAFKHSRNILMTSCNDKEVSKYLKQFLGKNKHVKITKEWPDCNGTILLTQ